MSVIIIVRKHWPLVAALVLLWFAVALLLILSLGQTQGHLIYALDDAYVHMAMAKNFADHGVWGITRYGFSSSSSSLLWTLLLSGVYALFGPDEVSPLILNLVFASLLVIWVHVILTRFKMPALYIFLVLSALVLFTPLPTLVFIGLEHVLHALATIYFAYVSARLLSGERPELRKRDFAALCMIAPFMTLVRFEGLYLTAVVCALLLARRRFLHSVFLGALGLVPVLLYGVISAAKGWYWLPNSIVLKSSLAAWVSRGRLQGLSRGSGLGQLVETPHLLCLMVVAVMLYFVRSKRENGFWECTQQMILIFVAALLLHVETAAVGWLHRYEAYLVALGLFVIAKAGLEFMPVAEETSNPRRVPSLRYGTTIAMMALIVFPLTQRGETAFLQTPGATRNIYEQQYQMGLFFRRFYSGAAVVANDMGAINYLADIRCLDLWGLATMDSARLRLGGDFGRECIYVLAKSKAARIGIVYDHWFEVPSEWIRVGEWKIPNNLVCGRDTVVFYAIDPSAESDLIANLTKFGPCLPRDVRQGGKYTQRLSGDLGKVLDRR